MKGYEFMHPEDAAALKQLESIPGFPALTKKIMELGMETLFYGTNTASNIRLSPQQLPDIYRHLPPICEKLGLKEPAFYLEMNPIPNAYTSGDTNIFIVVTSGLLEMMNDDEIDAVLAHECGHILCHHVLYHQMATLILNGVNNLGLLGKLAMPVQLAMFYWYRKSELSADRASALFSSPETVARVMARLAGGPKSLTQDINFEEWAQQAEEYERIRDGNTWNKTLQMYATATRSHPFSAVRVREILNWGKSDQYRQLKNALEGTGSQLPSLCPSCHRPVEPGWRFCQYCGSPL